MSAEGGAPELVRRLIRSPPPSAYAIRAILRNGALYVGGLSAVPILMNLSLWAPIAAMPVIGLAMYRLTIVMHDCIHGTLFASGRANRFVGVLAGAASGIEFHAFARLHLTHHRIAGEVGDPQGPDYFVPSSASKLALWWHLLRSLTGYNLFKLAQVFGAMRRSAPNEREEGPAGFVPVAIVQLSAMAVASSGFQVWWLAGLPLVSAATFGLFFAQLRGFAEHVTMPGIEPRGFVRSHRSNAIDRILLYDLNFNFHREHHLYPTVPSYWLPELQRHLFQLDAEGHMLSSGMFATIRQRLKAAGSPRRSLGDWPNGGAKGLLQ